MNDEASSISFQIVEQSEVIPEVDLSKVSKLIDSVIGKQRKHSFLEKKGLHKIKTDSLLINNQRYHTNGVIHSPILQEIFSCLQMYSM